MVASWPSENTARLSPQGASRAGAVLQGVANAARKPHLHANAAFMCNAQNGAFDVETHTILRSTLLPHDEAGWFNLPTSLKKAAALRSNPAAGVVHP
jgi:hypothetical protein